MSQESSDGNVVTGTSMRSMLAKILGQYAVDASVKKKAEGLIKTLDKFEKNEVVPEGLSADIGDVIRLVEASTPLSKEEERPVHSIKVQVPADEVQEVADEADRLRNELYKLLKQNKGSSAVMSLYNKIGVLKRGHKVPNNIRVEARKMLRQTQKSSVDNKTGEGGVGGTIPIMPKEEPRQKEAQAGQPKKGRMENNSSARTSSHLGGRGIGEMQAEMDRAIEESRQGQNSDIAGSSIDHNKRTDYKDRSDKFKANYKERSVEDLIAQVDRLQNLVNERRAGSGLSHARAGADVKLDGYVPFKLQLGKLKSELKRYEGRELNESELAHVHEIRANIAQYGEQFRKSLSEYKKGQGSSPSPEPLPEPDPNPDGEIEPRETGLILPPHIQKILDGIKAERQETRDEIKRLEGKIEELKRIMERRTGGEDPKDDKETGGEEPKRDENTPEDKDQHVKDYRKHEDAVDNNNKEDKDQHVKDYKKYLEDTNKSPELSAAQRLADGVALNAANRVEGVNFIDAERARTFVEGMSRKKRAVLYGAIGLAAAVGVGVASAIAAPALVAALGASSGWGFLAGIFGAKAVGGFAGHKLGGWIGDKMFGAKSLERSKAAAGHDKAMKKLRKASAFADSHSAELEITQTQLDKLVEKGYNRAKWMPAVASIATTAGAGLPLHYYWGDITSLFGGSNTPAPAQVPGHVTPQPPVQSTQLPGHTVIHPQNVPPTHMTPPVDLHPPTGEAGVIPGQGGTIAPAEIPQVPSVVQTPEIALGDGFSFTANIDSYVNTPHTGSFTGFAVDGGVEVIKQGTMEHGIYQVINNAESLLDGIDISESHERLIAQLLVHHGDVSGVVQPGPVDLKNLFANTDVINSVKDAIMRDPTGGWSFSTDRDEALKLLDLLYERAIK